ncbi:rhamnulokinase [Virgibacillus pantothenticus]|uniref:rhamnulokinase n=1 Tax=Virgibacillus pantothenticus TaxID=1473 RepID=UPI001C238ECF|nr:rhamnulokinase [Virgibacillus pantothenticus]MBU8568256.1 rhamnulokinase [Virgibacillus pantothenticus]MBU8602282.1 rhamnulokinase [Virgibacillus pantothenticus]MBU8636416.1 rhamnulokinase [Virgibacillus pantothenticus]MBU8644168.1 rhamnulokinase [Virgibacillus pantothenticus]MBU8648349.1 rhamnulokinase [Virgibacillus pantothenticus]
MRSCSLAVDIGASSGTVIAGYLQNKKMVIDEVYRFENRLIQKNGYFCWDIEKLFAEVKKGIHLTKKKGLIPVSIGVDTWAVDFVLLDENEELLMDAVSYRDPRTDGMMDEVFSIFSKELLYLETGIQFQKFNSIYQLYYVKKKYPELLEKAKTFLMIPDYFHYLLTGVKVNEYTNATTTQLINAFTKKWDRDLLKKLDINDQIFQQILLPKESIGRLRPQLVEEFGFDMEVILPATHDTASAVLAVPETDETIFISSGTWSLMGVENRFPICITKALDYNFTNEGGFDYRYRFLKNIMGLWMIQEVKRNYKDQYSFADFSDMAAKEKDFYAIVDVDDDRFLKPNNMIREIQLYCKETGQSEPTTPGQVAKCVFDSLAISYKNTIEQIEEIYEKNFNQINIIGGGSKNKLLNQLISDITEKEVIAGPSEATAIGNIISQLIALEQIEDIHEARNIIKNSFVLKTFRKREGGK